MILGDAGAFVNSRGAIAGHGLMKWGRARLLPILSRPSGRRPPEASECDGLPPADAELMLGLGSGGPSPSRYGFSLTSHAQTNCPHPGQPDPYFFRTAACRSTPATLAIVASHAR